jgi:hypothetical protein
MKEVGRDWQTENYIPSRRQALQYQDNYRNISVGFIPFMPLFRLHSDNAIASSMTMWKLEGKAGSDNAYFEWAPKVRGMNVFEAMSGESKGGEGAPFEATAEADYYQKTLHPFISWLYGGDLPSISLYARAISKGKKDFFSKGVDNWPTNISRKDMSKFIQKGITTGDNLKNSQTLEPIQAEKLFGGEVNDMQDLLELLDDIVGSKDGVAYKFKKTGFFGQKPFLGGKTGEAKTWAPSASLWALKAQKLSAKLLDDIVEAYKPDGDQVSDGEDSLSYVGEAMEENALSLLMERAEELNPNFTLNKVPDRQMTSNTAGEFDLPDEIAKTAGGHIRKAVDVSNKGREGAFLHAVAQLDNDHARDLKKLLSLDKDLSIGTEVTLFDIRQKGGYKVIGKMGPDLGSVNNPLTDMNDLSKAIDNVNQDQKTIIEAALADAGNDVKKAAKALETQSAKERKAAKQNKTKLSADHYVGDQARQTLVRFVDVLDARNTGASGFQFTSRFSVSTGDGVQNGAVGFSWTIKRSGLGNYTVTPEFPEIVTLDGDITNVLDMVGAALMGSADDWVNYRKSTFLKDLVNAVSKDEAIDSMLFDRWLVQAASSQSWSVFPEIRSSYKIPTEIAKDMADDIRKKIQDEAQQGSKFMKMLESDMKELRTNWRGNLKAGEWEGTRDFIKNAPTFFTPKGEGSVEAWAMPHMVGGKAGALAKPTSKSRWYDFTRV